MAYPTVQLGSLAVSRVILGSNPFSGFSHQGTERDLAMRHYYTVARIKAVMHEAEALGLETLIARADHHVMRLLTEYWDEGGTLNWIAQTCPELGPISRGIQNAIYGGAKACYVHGGVMDHLLANDGLAEVPEAIKMIRDAGMPAGIAGHNPRVFEWAEDHLDVDFYMCSYYNPISRDEQAEHVSGRPEWFSPADRDRMATLIQRLRRPAIHYKVFAAGRNDPREALDYVARHLRPQDAVCLGIFAADKPGMLAEDLQILQQALEAPAAGKA